MRLEQLVELCQRPLDLGIRTVDQRLDGTPDPIAQHVREVKHGTACLLLFLDPFRSLLLGLALAPGLKELGHVGNIGRRAVAGNPSPVYPFPRGYGSTARAGRGADPRSRS